MKRLEVNGAVRHIHMSLGGKGLKTLPSVYKTPFELQPEDGFIKKPKHVANMIF